MPCLYESCLVTRFLLLIVFFSFFISNIMAWRCRHSKRRKGEVFVKMTKDDNFLMFLFYYCAIYVILKSQINPNLGQKNIALFQEDRVAKKSLTRAAAKKMFLHKNGNHTARKPLNFSYETWYPRTWVDVLLNLPDIFQKYLEIPSFHRNLVMVKIVYEIKKN